LAALLAGSMAKENKFFFISMLCWIYWRTREDSNL